MKVRATAISLCLLACCPAARAGLFERKLELVERGNSEYAKNNYEKALQAYEEAEELVSDKPLLHFNRGAALHKLGRYREAREAFQRALGIEDPDMKKRILYNIGNTFLAEGAFRESIAYYRRALELDPGYEDARINLELALRALEQQKKSKNDKKDDKQQEKQKGKKEQNDNEKEKRDENKDEQSKDQQEQKKGENEQHKQEQSEQKSKQERKEQQQKQSENKESERQDQKQQENERGRQEQRQQAQQRQQERLDEKARPENHEQQQNPYRLDPKQLQALLEAMRENEKPFQVFRFAVPKFKRRQVDKDW